MYKISIYNSLEASGRDGNRDKSFIEDIYYMMVLIWETTTSYDFKGVFHISDPNLSDGEKEFIKMIGYYWAELGNHWNTVTGRYENKSWYNYSMIDNICAKLDEVFASHPYKEKKNHHIHQSRKILVWR